MHNYHTHTYRCKHAKGDVIDYAAEAVKAGMRSLGMSDHIPYPDGRWDFCRMEPHEMEGYIKAIEEARLAFPDLNLYRALESEWVPELHDYYCEMKEQWKLDYMIGAVHWFPYGGEWLAMKEMTTPARLRSFADHLISIMESGLFLFIAHPDNFGSGYLKWDKNCEAASRDIFTASLELNIPLEVNGFGFRKRMIETPDGLRKQYPLDPFWKLAGEFQVPTVFNSDAHKPSDVNANYDDLIQIIEANKLKVIDPMGVCCG
ncbi:MAG: histidinol-phosphatase [Spirochaetales bacterium]|nr:histidinol-phosphatase [Spirochaetales bacterium]